VSFSGIYSRGFDEWTNIDNLPLFLEMAENSIPRRSFIHAIFDNFYDTTVLSTKFNLREGMPSGIRSSESAMAETIENNLRRVIIEEKPTNPRYYEKMSELLDALTQERRQHAKEYQQYLKEIVELTQQVQNPASTGSYPSSLNTRAKRALYNNLENDEQLALAVDAKIRRVKKDKWKGNQIKEREVLYAIQGVVKDDDLANRIFELAKNQDEY
jgi:type I restriction enzyme R subunit